MFDQETEPIVAFIAADRSARKAGLSKAAAIARILNPQQVSHFVGLRRFQVRRKDQRLPGGYAFGAPHTSLPQNEPLAVPTRGTPQVPTRQGNHLMIAAGRSLAGNRRWYGRTQCPRTSRRRPQGSHSNQKHGTWSATHAQILAHSLQRELRKFCVTRAAG
jgi:hypothetical protein